jgi:PPM family protein phosphatase
MTVPRAVELRAGGLLLTVGAGSETGYRYRANFDVLHVEVVRDATLTVVLADGMGSGEGSAVAGRTAVDVFATAVREHPGPVEPRALRAAVAEAQRQVRAAGDRLRQLTGCTLTALVTDGDSGWLVQLGDSRAYRWRDGLLELLTSDHTVAWLGAVNGWYPADSPEATAARYQLTRYVGHPSLPEPDVFNVALRPGDVVCLCTDGLAEQVPYQRLADALGQVALGSAEPSTVAARLLADSLTAGGRDNTTVAVMRIVPG